MKLSSLAVSFILPAYVLAQHQPATMDMIPALGQLYALLNMLTHGDMNALDSFMAVHQTGAAATVAAPAPGITGPAETAMPIPTIPPSPPTLPSQRTLWTPTVSLLPTTTMTYGTTPGTTLTSSTTSTKVHVSSRNPVTKNVTVTMYPTFETTPSSDASWTTAAAVAALNVVFLTGFVVVITLYLSV